MIPSGRPAKYFLSGMLALAVMTAVAYAQSGRGVMKGFVVDESDIHGIGGAQIELQGDPESSRLRSIRLTSTANEQGEYFLKDVPYGDYILSVSAPGFSKYQINIYILSDATTQLHIKLRKAKEETRRPG